MRKLLAIIAAGFFFLSAYTLARSEECTLPFPAFVEATTANPATTVKPITDVEKAQLFEKKGPPPIDEPYEINIVRTPEVGLILVVKDGCIVARVGPVPVLQLESFLGNSGA